MAALPHRKRVVRRWQLSAFRGIPTPLVRFAMRRVHGCPVVLVMIMEGIKAIVCN
jgi:hypothetical protein